MLREVVCALPPLGAGRVADVLCGSGRAALEIRKAYPRCELWLLDADADRLAAAEARVAEPTHIMRTAISRKAETLPGAPSATGSRLEVFDGSG